MKGDMLYHGYLKRGSEYYGPHDQSNSAKEFFVEDQTADMVVFDDEKTIWRYYEFKGRALPAQGWKIHVSATMDEAEQVLKAVSEVLIEHQVAFKHIKNIEMLLQMNSKGANRASSGKFIAIYPKDDSEFVHLLGALQKKIKHYEKGPYILNDKCWKKSNVYYRYGGFNIIYNDKGELCIRDDKGELTVDERTPFYQAPDFVKEFDEYLDALNDKPDNEDQNSKLDLYTIHTALRFTNSGGIYLAERKSDNKKVIIKEARPQAGLDGNSVDAVGRQNIERDALEKLSSVEGIVNVLDHFKVWEHYFLIEEHVEGMDLHSWIAINYPFMKNKPLDDYRTKIGKILSQLVVIMEEIHDKGVAMGDLQPANIMISEDLQVTLIDFETAKQTHSQEKPGMATTGFINSQIKTSGGMDWFALQKIVRYSLLPILSSECLDPHINDHYFKWIKTVYGNEFYQFVQGIIQKCADHLVGFGEKVPLFDNMDEDFVLKKDILSIIEGLSDGIKANLTGDIRLINGDIRQYEQNDGKLNVLSGGTGAAIALSRVGRANDELHEWITQYALKSVDTVESAGLFTGKSGIAGMLYENGYKDESLHIFSEIDSFLDDSDITLRSGLAGIGLALTSLYLETLDPKFLEKAELIATKIDMFLEENREITVQDWTGLPIGLIDGWSGVSVFYSALYALTEKREYYFRAIELVVRDLNKTVRDNELEALNTIDNRSRLLPYLSGGSIGVGVAIWYLNHVSEEKMFQEELKFISNLSQIRTTISGGLFDGAGSFLVIPPMIGKDHVAYHSQTEDILELLNLHLIDKKNYLSFPGQFGFRLSDDLFSGSSGIILGLKGILQENPLYWLPIVNIDRFYEDTRFNRETSKMMVGVD
ncbi:class III lanthionine synthetase LanKC [Baia soyae]|uniref:Protein kinase-like protein n=1 Tax=Baia soyae TaxID=1544746 RepID=A0A4R2S1P0_9BACL|nr:class III lanthionine synthetase LanKC [Baia soyae]TCP70270.1 protein kinase-like protein [Baia soyae]